MKQTQLGAFQDAIGKSLLDCYLILSKKEFERHAALKAILEKMKGDSLIKKKVLEHPFTQIIEELNSASLFAGKRALVLEGVEKLAKKDEEFLERYLSTPPFLMRLILVGSSLPPKSALYKKVEQVGVVLDVEPEKPWEKQKNMTKWLIEQAALHQKRLLPDAADFLFQLFSLEHYYLDQELAKIVSFVGDRAEITKRDIEQIVTPYKEQSVFALVDAIFKMDSRSALLTLHTLVSQEMPYLVILRQLRNQYQTGLILLEMLARGARDAISKRFPQYSANWVDKQSATLQRYGYSRLRQGLLLIDQAELLFKGSTPHPQLLIERLIEQLS
ncbi:MAG: hypothetical protein K0S07_312 [Chlamydiales bacterium]|jgi:DNA polymerase-3 subunit delta|nr:hypothetical protein [Chlamydiales bacterium]